MHSLSQLFDRKILKASWFKKKEKYSVSDFLNIVSENPAVLYTINLTIITEIWRLLGLDDKVLNTLNNLQVTREKDFKSILSNIRDFLFILWKHMRSIKDSSMNGLIPFKKMRGKKLNLEPEEYICPTIEAFDINPNFEKDLESDFQGFFLSLNKNEIKFNYNIDELNQNMVSWRKGKSKRQAGRKRVKKNQIWKPSFTKLIIPNEYEYWQGF